MYSQFEEEKIIQDYFGDFIGNLIDIGANDGKTLSNTLRCIERGWGGILIEPTDLAFERLQELHKQRSNVVCKKAAVSTKNGEGTMIVNGSHYGTGDTGLLSRLITDFVDESKKDEDVPKDAYGWKNYTHVRMIDFNTLIQESEVKKFDLISIDAEGHDWSILQQINLTELETKMLIVEYDGVNSQHFVDYCKKHNMILKEKTVTNLIFVK